MVLTSFSGRTVRLAVRGSAHQLEPIGQILEQLFPGDVLVSSDEDEASGQPEPSALEILSDTPSL